MIIWINGAFGSGKTTLAELLQQKLTSSFIYDPETIGSFLTANLPKAMSLDDFQDYPEWRQWNIQLLKKLNADYQGDIIVPMSLYKKAYFDEIMTGLAESGVEIRHFLLNVDKGVILERLMRRDDGTLEWGMSKVDEALRFFEAIPNSQKICNQNRPLTEVVNEMIKRLKE